MSTAKLENKATEEAQNMKEEVTDEQTDAIEAEKPEDRYYENTYPDYSGQKVLEADGKLQSSMSKRVLSVVNKLIEKFNTELDKYPLGTDMEVVKQMFPMLDNIEEDLKEYSYSVYMGYIGIAYTYLHLYTKLDKEKDTRYLHLAKKYIDKSYDKEDFLKTSYMFGFGMGVPGLYAVAAVVEAKLGNRDESKSNIKKLIDFHEHMCSCNQIEVPNEYILGRCGYLYALLYVNDKLGEGAIRKYIIKKVCTHIIEIGRQMATEEKSKFALMYRNYTNDSPPEESLPVFIDIAHGLAGVLYMLMQVNDLEISPLLEKLVKPTVDSVIEHKHPSGNYCACIEPDDFDADLLVHWCHGSPGMIYLFTLAYKVFGDKKYLIEALGCSDVTWRRGLLRKGFTICHGISGNGYSFLPVWHASGDEKHLYRASKFLEYTCDFEKHGCMGEEPNSSPMSLSCGLGGTICFLVDMLEPGTAKFPAFEVQNQLNSKPVDSKF